MLTEVKMFYLRATNTDGVIERERGYATMADATEDFDNFVKEAKGKILFQLIDGETDEVIAEKVN